MSQVSKFTDDD